ncbi:FD5-like protein [Mya arenaria]|uniref:FD5-like protein n=1 Tax=Mya arenaria TaxID=6604 RepID=A0ABY7DSR4_MYAAR|nr:FD5-like protein [Mya arenaria]
MEPQLPFYASASSGSGPSASFQLNLELQRAQLQEYAQRVQLGLRGFPGQFPGVGSLSYPAHLVSPYFHPYLCKDPRARFVHEEPKPNHSYIGLIAMAILSSRDRKLVLSDIYQWILDNYSYFRTRGPGWRNSIRHNLSLNDCFIKSGRSANGKGHYWAIHPANVDDFQKGDFRRRRAQRRVRRHMGLSVTDEDEDDSPAASPIPPAQGGVAWGSGEALSPDMPQDLSRHSPKIEDTEQTEATDPSPTKRIRRQFDMDSLLAPDTRTNTAMGKEMAFIKATHYSNIQSLSSPYFDNLSKLQGTYQRQYMKTPESDQEAIDVDSRGNEQVAPSRREQKGSESSSQNDRDSGHGSESGEVIDMSAAGQGEVMSAFQKIKRKHSVSPKEGNSSENESSEHSLPTGHGSDSGRETDRDNTDVRSQEDKEDGRSCSSAPTLLHPGPSYYSLPGTGRPFAFERPRGHMSRMPPLMIQGIRTAQDMQRYKSMDMFSRHRLPLTSVPKYPLYGAPGVPTSLELGQDAVQKWQQSIAASMFVGTFQKDRHFIK